MAFIGNTNTTQAFTPAIDFFSGNGSTTAFTLSRPVASVAQVQVTIDNVAQNPSSAFTVSANTITFTSAPLSGTNNVYVYYTSPITQVIAPGQGTVTTTSLTSGLTLASPNITTALTLTGASGTNGQLLTSGGSGNAPTWTTVSAPSAATPTALGTVYGETGTSQDTFIGYNAGLNNTGSYNSALGVDALKINTTSEQITAIGWNAGKNTTGTRGTFLGCQAGQDSTNVDNTGIGNQALQQNTSGAYNTGCGSYALTTQTTANFNAAVGYKALQNTVASGNTALGYQAGISISNGSQDIYIGTNADSSSASVNYEIVLGVNSSVGKGGSTGFINPNGGGVYQGNNSSSWSTTSDRRLKKNITDNTEGLDKVVQIRVRNFEYRTEEEIIELDELPVHTVVKKEGIQLGVIAQELQEICPDCVKTETTGVISVDSDNIFWHMVNAIKDLKALNDTQAETITALTARITALENK